MADEQSFETMFVCFESVLVSDDSWISGVQFAINVERVTALSFLGNILVRRRLTRLYFGIIFGQLSSYLTNVTGLLYTFWISSCLFSLNTVVTAFKSADFILRCSNKYVWVTQLYILPLFSVIPSGRNVGKLRESMVGIDQMMAEQLLVTERHRTLARKHCQSATTESTHYLMNHNIL